MPSDISPEIHRKLRQLASAAAQRAGTRGLPVETDLPDRVLALYRAQNGRCALTGRAFDLRQVGQGKARRPFAPSIDRVDASGGYTRDNIRLVCQVVNFALNAYGEDVFYEMARLAAAQAGAIPSAIASDDPEAEKQRKRRYTDYVADAVPRLLAANGGIMAKDALRQFLRSHYAGDIPEDEANAYG